MKALHAVCASLALSLGACAPTIARAPDADLDLQRAIGTAHRVRIDGPAEVRIAGRMVLHLQAGLTYVPPAEGERLLRAMGERPRGKILGVVVSGGAETGIAVVYAKEPLIGGIPDLEVAGWNQAPQLDRFRQR
jgi:uncharacterized membrane-anchored protein